jgi:hypothetical protein
VIIMPRKKIDPLVGLGQEDKLTVSKSLPLYALWRSDLTLSEFKILDTYLARIDSHHPERRVVTFEKGELEEKLGVQRINNADLKTRLKHLMGNVVEVPDKDSKRGFRLVTLFEEVEAEQDDYGLWQVKLECTQKAMKYFFNIENLGYLRYKLRCITSLTSRYTYVLFLYLEHNRTRHLSWEVPLDELKTVLHCESDETYKEFKYFNDKILKKAYKELHEKTECRYTYEPIKKWRSVVAIRFTLESITTPQIEEPDVQIPITQTDSWEDFIADACCPAGSDKPEFSSEEMQELISVIVCLPEDKLPPDNDGLGIEFQRHHYLAQQYAALNRYAARNPIKHRFAYLLRMIKHDAGMA